MANTTKQVPIATTSWGDTRDKYPSPAGAASYYQNAMVGQDASGNLQKLDDTQALLFIGLIFDSYVPTTDSTDAAGAISLNVQKPWLFTMPLNGTPAEGMEGRKVWASADNQVSLTPGTHANLVGKIYRIKSTAANGEVWIAPPWSPLFADGGSYNGFISAAAAAGTTLTQFDVNKIVLCPLTANENITLPAVANTSPGDRILFINTSANSSVPTLVGHAAENINGANTFAMTSTQYSSVEVVSDGTQWYVDVPNSGTLGATTFTGRVLAKLLAVGPAATDTYAAAMTIDVTKSLHIISAVSGTSATVTFTPSAAGSAGDLLTIITETDASGTVTATFASTFHSSGTQATTASKFSSIVFQSDGTRWVEVCRTTALS